MCALMASGSARRFGRARHVKSHSQPIHAGHLNTALRNATVENASVAGIHLSLIPIDRHIAVRTAKSEHRYASDANVYSSRRKIHAGVFAVSSVTMNSSVLSAQCGIQGMVTKSSRCRKGHQEPSANTAPVGINGCLNTDMSCRITLGGHCSSTRMSITSMGVEGITGLGILNCGNVRSRQECAEPITTALVAAAIFDASGIVGL